MVRAVLEISRTLARGHREISLTLTNKLPPYQSVFIELESDIEVSGREKALMVLPSIGFCLL